MKIFHMRFMILTAGAYGLDGKDNPLPNSPSVPGVVINTNEVTHASALDYTEQNQPLLIQNNYNGWLNPEDLAPMPQCIAQQDQSAWLSTMTKCTSKRCTSHFGFICTHHQWLTQLSCLSVEFSSDVIQKYFSYCDRSILAKAQLYEWVRKITGRTWLVNVGDASGLATLSPASLADGYSAVDVVHHAPTCLTGSTSSLSLESFQRVMASCSFGSTTQHTGNAARPWEYSEHLRSMIALDAEAVGYDLVGRRIKDGEYFDKACLCTAFTIDFKKEPCAGSGQLDLTKERLWIHATCGAAYLPDNWAETLRTTQFAYIPMEAWHWPKCVADMPDQVTDLTTQCAADACELDSNGYCKVTPAVDRACVCRGISYNSCGGSCQVFETRIDYVNWLYNLCGNVQEWHGLPDSWRQLAAPTPLEMIPWQWIVRPFNNSSMANMTRLPYAEASETCVSNEWKLGSLVVASLATPLALVLGQKISKSRVAHSYPRQSHLWCWISKGTLFAALQIFANWLNALLVQNTSGYGDVPVLQLMLLWCSIPRLTWLTILLLGLHQSEAIRFITGGSMLFSEILLQSLSSYHMFMTINYGREHKFYFGGIGDAEKGTPAKSMYAGALMWLMAIGTTIIQLTRAMHKSNRLTGSGSLDPQDQPRDTHPTSKVPELTNPLHESYSRSRENLAHYWMNKSSSPEKTLLISGDARYYTDYGSLSNNHQRHYDSQKALTESYVDLYTTTVIGMFLLWIAQWLFWGGFIGLSSEEFCLPGIGVLTGVWVIFSFAGATVMNL
ncbi:hypothetical protein BDV25DRAFT_147879 [Aspergillus avenaceus]|uniref:Uncharacterized protein n=1 Tax=Aspergillus avenaceus TaxID=36643 RepID=A0A5N6U855_ASPAV|nr:hypothetical protein BDV25DRAFT_147879 [Aspergillus avenaceus]